MKRTLRASATIVTVALLTVITASTGVADSADGPSTDPDTTSSTGIPPGFSIEPHPVAAPGAGGYIRVPSSVISVPPTVTAADIHFAPPERTLHYGTAEQVGLDPTYIDQIAIDIARFLEQPPPPAEHPQYPGAVALAAHDGVIVSHEAVGYALRYANADGADLPLDEWIPMRTDTIFDVASMTKLFTSIVAVQLIEEGRIGLNVPVATYIPRFALNGKSTITIRNLLTHTSGLPADPDPSLCTYPTPEAQWDAVYTVKPIASPDAAFLYSDMNMMTLGRVIEKITGQPLDQAIAERITAPLGMTETLFNPPASLKPRIAAEEYRPDGTLVWGTVHDENAACTGGVSGHAGVFSTAHDLAILAQALLNGGEYASARILSEASTRLLFTDFNQAFPGHSHGLGFELDQRRYMGALSSPVTAGHTGFTGTSIVIDPLAHSFAILLTNRVHPTRKWGNNNLSRATVGSDLALALPVRPVGSHTEWFAGTASNATATLRIPVTVPDCEAEISFGLWYDTAETDAGALEASSDGGMTWQLVPLSLRAESRHWQTDGSFTGFEGRQWLKASGELPGSTTNVRWRYTTGAFPQGRGVFVDRVQVTDRSGEVIFDDRRPGDAAEFQPIGWTLLHFGQHS